MASNISVVAQCSNTTELVVELWGRDESDKDRLVTTLIFQNGETLNHEEIDCGYRSARIYERKKVMNTNPTVESND